MRVLDVVLPQGGVLALHDAIIQHLEVGQQDVRRIADYGVAVLYDSVGLHHLTEILLVRSLSNEQASGDLVAQSFVRIYHFGKAFRLVCGKGVHRVKDDDLDTLLADMPVAVVKDREEETLSLT